MAQKICKPDERFEAYKESRHEASVRTQQEFLKCQNTEYKNQLWFEFYEDIDSTLPFTLEPDWQLMKYSPLRTKDIITVYEANGLGIETKQLIDPIPTAFSKAITQ